MKKIMALLSVFAFTFSLAGCRSQNSKNTDPGTQSATGTQGGEVVVCQKAMHQAPERYLLHTSPVQGTPKSRSPKSTIY